MGYNVFANQRMFTPDYDYAGNPINGPFFVCWWDGRYASKEMDTRNSCCYEASCRDVWCTSMCTLAVVWRYWVNRWEISKSNRRHSLRVSTLPSIEHSLREDGMQFLRSGFVTNPSVTMLYDENNLYSEASLVSILQTMDPFFAQMAHVFFVNSNESLLKRLSSRFTSVRTIESIIMQNRRCTLVTEISRQNENYKIMFRNHLQIKKYIKEYRMSYTGCWYC